MPSLGPTELILILAIVLIVLGPGKIPDLGKAIGGSLREFRRATKVDDDSVAERSTEAAAE
jgi:sec-independent protein translocase protein TatA